MPKAPKGATILAADDMAAWLAEIVQEKVGKENSGLMEINLVKSHGDLNGRVPAQIKLRPSAGNQRGFKVTVEIDV